VVLANQVRDPPISLLRLTVQCGRMPSRRGFLFASLLSLVLITATRPLAQAPADRPSANVVARSIDPAGVLLPLEADSGNQTKFSFIAYGDTRGPADGSIIQPEHKGVIDRMLTAIAEEGQAGFPVRFVVQSGDAVVTGRYGNQWNTSFNPLIERLIHEGRVPYLFAVGNHDVGGMPLRSPERDAGLRNAAEAMARLWPLEGSSRTSPAIRRNSTGSRSSWKPSIACASVTSWPSFIIRC